MTHGEFIIPTPLPEGIAAINQLCNLDKITKILKSQDYFHNSIIIIKSLDYRNQSQSIPIKQREITIYLWHII